MLEHSPLSYLASRLGEQPLPAVCPSQLVFLSPQRSIAAEQHPLSALVHGVKLWIDRVRQMDGTWDGLWGCGLLGTGK